MSPSRRVRAVAAVAVMFAAAACGGGGGNPALNLLNKALAGLGKQTSVHVTISQPNATKGANSGDVQVGQSASTATFTAVRSGRTSKGQAVVSGGYVYLRGADFIVQLTGSGQTAKLDAYERKMIGGHWVRMDAGIGTALGVYTIGSLVEHARCSDQSAKEGPAATVGGHRVVTVTCGTRRYELAGSGTPWLSSVVETDSGQTTTIAELGTPVTAGPPTDIIDLAAAPPTSSS